MSPLEHIIGWFKSLPKEQQVDTAVLVSSMPGFFHDYESEDIPEKFLEQIESHRGHIHQEFVLVLCLKAVIEEVIISQRNNKQGWKERQEMLEKLAVDKNSTTFAELAQKKEFQGAQWISSCKKWEDMADTHLTPQKIRYWMDGEFINLKF